MKSVKRVFALILMLAMVLSLASCGQDITWIAKKGDTTIPVGVYIYALDMEASAAKEKVADRTVEVLKQEVDGQPAKDWILAEAKRDIQKIIAVNEWMSELDIALTKEENSSIQNTVEQYWESYGAKTTYEPKGVAKSSFLMAYSQSAKEFSVFKKIYDKGGAKAVSQADIEKYYVENYYNVSMIAVPLTNSDQEPITAEEKARFQTAFEGYKKQLEDGKTFEELKAAYETDNKDKEETETDGFQFGTDDYPIDAETVDPTFLAVQGLKVGAFEIIDANSYLYLAVKNDPEKAKTAFYNDDSKRVQIVSKLKDEEFQLELKTRAEAVEGLVLNQAALNKYQPQSPTVDSPSSTPAATSPAPSSDTGSGESSGASSDTASPGSSSDTASPDSSDTSS